VKDLGGDTAKNPFMTDYSGFGAFAQKMRAESKSVIQRNDPPS
jgi:hypothetical protein